MHRLLLLVLLSGCPSWLGLTELAELPPEFPVTPVGERGNVTVSAAAPDGRVATAVDLAFDREEDARAGYDAVRAELEGEGWVESATLDGDEGVVFTRGTEAVEVSCCRHRADTKQLVLVAWRHAP